MKRVLTCAAAVGLLVSSVLAQDELPIPNQGHGGFPSTQDMISYAVGLNFGKGMSQSGVTLNTDQVIRGIRDGLGTGKVLLNDEQVQEAIIAFEQQIAEVQRRRGEDFLTANSKKEGVQILAGGLQYKVLETGKGASPMITDRVSTHYRGTLIDGTEFDSSYSRGQPARFPVGGVIRGWSIALQKMKVGDKWQLFVPSDLAYGERGFPPAIGPNAVLIFEIELLDIEQ